jgi:TonB family protein
MAASMRRVALACGIPLFLVLSVSAQDSRKRIVEETPVYPPMAKALQLTGTVKVQVIIGTDGQIRETKVLGGSPVLVAATLEALKKWRYAPAPVETTAELQFNFHP